MAIMGGSIGMAFALSMVAGPLIASSVGVPFLFYFVSFLFSFIPKYFLPILLIASNLIS